MRRHTGNQKVVQQSRGEVLTGGFLTDVLCSVPKQITAKVIKVSNTYKI